VDELAMFRAPNMALTDVCDPEQCLADEGDDEPDSQAFATIRHQTTSADLARIAAVDNWIAARSNRCAAL
jgi:hypothetical protein